MMLSLCKYELGRILFSVEYYYLRNKEVGEVLKMSETLAVIGCFLNVGNVENSGIPCSVFLYKHRYSASYVFLHFS